MNILDIIQQDLALMHRGKDWWAPCPFHTEDTASFSVSPDKQFFHCFGCGAHGDVIDWLRKYRGYCYRDAAKAVGRLLTPAPLRFSPLFAVARAVIRLAEEKDDFAIAWTMLRAKLHQAATLPELHSDAYKLDLARQLTILLDWDSVLTHVEQQIRTHRDGLL